MFRNARERIGARGLVLLAAAPLLGAVPMQDAAGGTVAEGPVPVAHKRPHKDGGTAPGKPKPPAPKAQAKPKAHTKPESHAKPKAHGKPRAHAKPKAHGNPKVHAKPEAAHAEPRPAAKPKANGKKKGEAVLLSMNGPGTPVIPGGTYNWPFAVTTKGSAKERGRAHRAVFTARLPRTLKFVSGQPNCSAAERGVVCRLGVVEPGQTIAGVLTAKVSKGADAGRTIRSRGRARWGKARTKRMFPAVRVARTADLAMSKTGPVTARAGSAIPYETKVRNLGPSTAEDVVVQSEGAARLVGRDTACVPRGTGYTCTIGSLRPGRERTLRTKVMPDATARAGTVLESPSLATTSTIDLNSANNRAVARTTITDAAAGPATGAPERPLPAPETGAGAVEKAVEKDVAARPVAHVEAVPDGAVPPSGGPVEQPARPPKAAGFSLTGTRTGVVLEIALVMVGTGFALTRLGRRHRRRRAED
ncbi:hypothetical protein AGRA3207_001394 [Actinomadura graeca]|uniref:DUF11 domain-containing protein n=1 Tax=Actinomadura graeca TaxID=2750812 RepID=A0ABX8QR08_9ACTN|nr:DUF11 domain-containing protein [Actinomadura graeca]QXJ20644.1 hypothetical protein AGRA3207_001394 [Actinomadura graeca]